MRRLALRLHPPVLVLLLAASPWPAHSADTKGGALSVIDAEKAPLTTTQFAALPDSQPLLYKGQRYTAGQVRALQSQVLAKHAAWLGDTQARASFKAHRDKFLADQKTQLDSEKAKGLAEYEQRFHSASTMAPILKR